MSNTGGQWIHLHQGAEHCARVGDKFIVDRSCYDEGDLHNFKHNFRTIKGGTVITAKLIWFNGLGTFVRFEMNGEVYDIKPMYLKLPTDGSEG